MKKALSLFLVVLMLVGMLPMTVLNASAAEVSETIALAGSTGTVSGESISWTSEKLAFTANKNTSSTAIRTSDTDHFRLYVGFSATLTCSAGNITKIEMVATGSSYAIAPTGADGSVGTVSGTTITIVPKEASQTYTIPNISKQTRIKSITVTYNDPNATGCAHTNTETVEAVAATCTKAGNTAGVKCTDCGATVSGNETIEALGHKNDAGVVTAPTCTEDGYTTYTCTVCGSAKKDDYVDATGHNYVDGVCSVCKIEMPTGLDGKYYIAAIRSSGNYQYMTNDLGTASTKRYQIVDSGLTVLPENITAPVDAQVFELVSATDAGTYKIKTGDQYLGWTSGNSGALVDEASAIAATIEAAENGAYTIHFTASDAERYLSLNSNASYAYFAWYKSGQISDLYLVPVASEGGEGGSEPEPEVTEPEVTEPSAPATCPDENHNFVDGKCTICGETEPIGPIDPSDPILPENSATYIFSDYNQEKAIEAATTYKLDDTVSITLSKGWLTSELRVYKGANVVFTSTKPIAQIDFNGGNKDGKADIYVTTDGTTWKLLTEIAYVTTYTDYSVKLPSNVIGVKIEVLDNQIRIKNATLTFGEFVECSHANATEIPAKDATCTESGNKAGMYCADCDTYFGGYEVIPATGHSYAYVDGTVSCSACGDAVALSTIAEAKAFTDKNQVYFVKGIVTYITGNSVYIEDATGAILVYFDKNADISTIALGDELAVWDTLTVYNGAVIETTYTLASESVVVSSGNTVPMKELTIAELLAATESKYLSEKITLKGVTVTASDYNADYGNVTYTLSDSEGNSIVVYRAPAASAEECFQVGDKVDVEAVVAAYVNGSTEGNGYQLTTDHTLITLAKEEPTGPVVAEDLVFQTVGVSFQEYIGLQPAILLSTAKNYQNIYLEVVQETVNGVVTEEIEGFEFYNYYLAFDKQVQSWSMADKITLTVYAEKDGKQYCSEPYTCTVEGLAIEKIKTTTNEKLKRTFVDMLNYGAAVQTRFGHNAGNLANKNLGELSALGTQTDAVLSKTNSVVDNGTIDVLQVNPSMQARVEVQFIYIGDVSKYEVRYTVDGVEQEPIPYSEFMDFYSYKVARVPIKAANMRSDCVISLYDPATGEAVSNIYHCSIEGYALEKATSDMADVYKAMMKYGDSVAAYAAG